MRVIPTGIVGFFLASPAATLPSFQAGYDLKCEGNMSALDAAKGEAHSSPFAMTLHVDLEHKLFCQDSCETREKISKVLPSNIIFRAVSVPLPNRLWVADTGQFSYTWGEAVPRDEKAAMRFAHGFCTKVLPHPSIDRKDVYQRGPVPPPIGQKLSDQPRSDKVNAREISALIDIQNHRPVPASMYKRLRQKGLARLDDDLWVLTTKAEEIITGERR